MPDGMHVDTFAATLSVPQGPISSFAHFMEVGYTPIVLGILGPTRVRQKELVPGLLKGPN